MKDTKFRAYITPITIVYFTLFDLVRPDPSFSVRGLVIPWLRSGHKPDKYIGIKDKNNKEIYEGDIMRDGKNPNLIGVVFWNDLRAMFGIDPSACGREAADSGKFITPFDDWLDWEVISNIHENPDLLGIQK